MVPIGVLLGVIALIALLVVLGQQEQATEGGPSSTERVGNAAKPKPQNRSKAKAKGPKPVDRAKLLHVVETLPERADAPEGAPNVVLVTADSLRRDQLTPYGGPAETSPFLSRLAERGVVFTDTIAAGPWAKPALVSLFTGQHALTVGMTQPGDDGNHRVLADGVTTLAERLQSAGWFTAGLTANFNNNHKYGLAQGFDAWRDAHPAAFHPRTRLSADTAIDELFALLDDRPDEASALPVYAQISLVDLHKPFSIPKDEFEKFESDDHNIAPYLAMVKRTDDALEKLANGLETRGLTSENTLFVFIGAHGEGLGMPQHHGKQHGRTLYRSSVQVPWVIAGPGIKAKHRVGGVTHQTDLLPTVLGLTGVELGEERLAGVDHSALARGDGDRSGTEAVFTDTWYFTANHAAVYANGTVCQRDFGTSAGQKIATGCYDREADPDGADLSESSEDALLEALTGWRQARQAEYDAWPQLADAP
jgi:arylsulfatase A-like enzyme